jgi:hypothetical protein
MPWWSWFALAFSVIIVVNRLRDVRNLLGQLHDTLSPSSAE